MRKIAKNTIAQPLYKDNEFNDKVKSLYRYIYSRKHIDVISHRSVCQSFGLNYMPEVFRMAYENKFLESLHEPKTAANVSLITGIPRHYLCQLKRRLEKEGVIKISHLDRCPVSGSNNVQYLTTTL